MSNWGILIGVGQGIQDAAGMWNEHKKGELAERLTKEREQRQVDRDLAKEQRQEAARLRQVANTSVDVDPVTGGMVRTLYNERYEPLGTAAVGQMEAEGIRRQKEKDEAELRAKSLEAQLKELTVGNAPAKFQREAEIHEARVASERASQAQRYAAANFSNRRGQEGSVTEDRNSASDARILMDTYSDLVEEYTTAPRDGKAILTRAQAEDVAQATIQRAVDNRLNPGQVAQAFRQALRITAERNKNATPPPRRSSGTGSGPAPRT